MITPKPRGWLVFAILLPLFLMWGIAPIAVADDGVIAGDVVAAEETVASEDPQTDEATVPEEPTTPGAEEEPAPEPETDTEVVPEEATETEPTQGTGSEPDLGEEVVPTGEEDVDPAGEAGTDAVRSLKQTPPGNQGTVKVDGLEFDDRPDNQPKPSCYFQIDYTGFDPGQIVSHSFTIQSGDGQGTVLPEGISNQVLASGSGSFTHDLSDDLAGYTPKEDGYYHIKLDVNISGVPGGQKHKVFKVKCGSDVPPGAIKIVKETNAPQLDEQFAFTGDLGDFTLGDGESIGPIEVEPGTYDVSEILTAEQISAGWSFDETVCVSEFPELSALDTQPVHTESIDVDEYELVTCTFYNLYTQPEPEEATIVIEKATIGDEPEGDEEFAFGGDLGDFQLGAEDSRSFTVEPGAYSVGEDVEGLPEDWSFEDAVCVENGEVTGEPSTVSGAVASIDVSAGETVTCTFTNGYDEVLGDKLDREPTPDVDDEVLGRVLPFTGTDPLLLLVIGLGLLVSGFAAMRLGRTSR